MKKSQFTTFFSILSLSAFMTLSAQPAYADRDKHEKNEKHEYKDRDKKSYKQPEQTDYRYSERNDLPHGLNKRSEKTGKPLPPGWQKKLHRGEVMDREVYEHGKVMGPVDIDGRVTISIDGKLVRLYQHTREIIDILN
ncbi:hypothetical protein J3998_04505 [Thiomicrorhabdus sp. 6S2-11]|uniref:RcnB family protein n=1 Tax=Thiomicrorhabdus marina TaxID=2818442 RepID=A0ABS3Q403_9GAMM|nr:hypothetical protein [Thiomicrorhabdus marina]MBO1926828.1 hypothetical protein [Thiomicrorhabdus marina]